MLLLVALIMLATLAVDVVRITRYSLAANRLNAQADSLARQGLARGVNADGDLAAKLDQRLAHLRGPGQGFTRMAAAALAAIRATPGSEASGLDFQPNGDLRITLIAQSDAESNAVQARLRDAGFAVTPGAFESAGGRLKGDLTVRAQ